MTVAAELFTGALTEGYEYRPRWIESRPVITVGTHQIKRYEIRVDGATSDRPLDDEDWRTLLASSGALAEGGPAELGFAILHHARDGVYLLVSRWYGGHMLKHELFRVGRTPRWQVASMADTKIIACIWELAVLEFECKAWIRTAMAGLGTPAALALYLQTTFTGCV